MTRWHHVGTALVLALAMCAIEAPHGVAAQNTFTCGQDQSLPVPIPLLWTTIVLAGDGRLYSPCPGGSHGEDHRERREAALIGEARYLPDELRWRAAQAQARNSNRPQVFPVLGGEGPSDFVQAQVSGLGGLVADLTMVSACSGDVQVFDGATNPRRWQPGRLFFMVGEAVQQFWIATRTRGRVARPSPSDMALIRRQVASEGAYAIGVQLLRPDLDANVVTAATNELRACFTLAGDGDLAGLLLEDLGLARSEKEDEIQETENFLAQQSYGTAARILGAVRGLEALLRQHPQHPIGDQARTRLRQLVIYGARSMTSPALDADARIRRLALMALQATHDLDEPTLSAAVTDGDWQVRRLVAGNLNLFDPRMAALGEALASDPAFQVRYELLSPIARRATETRDCGPIIERFNDLSPIVVMRAMDVLPATCNDLDEIAKKLVDFADRLPNASDDTCTGTPTREPWWPSRASDLPPPSLASRRRRRAPSGKCAPRWRLPAASSGTKPRQRSWPAIPSPTSGRRPSTRCSACGAPRSCPRRSTR